MATRNTAVDAFLPNRTISPSVWKIWLIGEAAMAIALWWLLPLQIIPKPAEVILALRGLWMEGLGRELIVSVILTIQAIAWTVIISLALSDLTVLPAFRPIAAAISKGRFLGLIGLTLIFTLTVGGGHKRKLSLLVCGMTVFFVTSMAAVIAELPKERFDHARTLGMSEWRVGGGGVVPCTADEALEVVRLQTRFCGDILNMVEGVLHRLGGLVGVLLLHNKDLPPTE